VDGGDDDAVAGHGVDDRIDVRRGDANEESARATAVGGGLECAQPEDRAAGPFDGAHGVGKPLPWRAEVEVDAGGVLAGRAVEEAAQQVGLGDDADDLAATSIGSSGRTLSAGSVIAALTLVESRYPLCSRRSLSIPARTPAASTTGAWRKPCARISFQTTSSRSSAVTQ